MRVVIVGAGPAGLAAARCADESGADVTLIDDNHSTGGQIWRGSASVSRTSIRTLLSSRVISGNATELHLESGILAFDKLIVATGARELFLPFPGWTLPGVFGAGGLQALAKSGLDLSGKRIVVAGTGPLLLTVAAYFRRHGADVLMIAEQAPWICLMRFGTALPPSKWWDALRLLSPRLSPSTWVTEVHGVDRLESVTLQNGRNIECDYLANGYGLIPNRELTQLLGVDASTVDDFQRTSKPDIFCAGEITGIGGVELSVAEGSIAGYAAAGNLDRARALFRERRKWVRFQRALQKAFLLRPDLRLLPKPDTIVCRCEDVTYRELIDKLSWREAKIHSRCGMGPCQGRVCGPAVEFLFGWRAEPVRPPIFPARVGSLSHIKEKNE